MASEMDAMIAKAEQFRGGSTQSFRGTEALGQQPREISDAETRSTAVVGQVTFDLKNLRVRGLGIKPAAPTNSPFIIAENERYELTVDIEFNRSPLTELLMCLGTRMTVNFGIEGYGVNAPEIDVQATELTQKGVFEYTVTYSAVAKKDGLLPGLYEIGAVATIGPVENKCTTKIWGHGYIKEVVLQVYPEGQE